MYPEVPRRQPPGRSSALKYGRLCRPVERGPLQVRSHIEKFRASEVTKSETVFDAAGRHFDDVPDGTLRTRNAGSFHRAALNAYSQASNEHNVFVLYGVVPQRLKDGRGRSFSASADS